MSASDKEHALEVFREVAGYPSFAELAAAMQFLPEVARRVLVVEEVPEAVEFTPVSKPKPSMSKPSLPPRRLYA